MAALSSSELMCYALSSNFLPITNGSIWTLRNVAHLKSMALIAVKVQHAYTVPYLNSRHTQTHTHTHTHTLAIAHDLQVPKARKARSVDVLFILDATASMRWGKGTWHCMR